jgi:hypothetical protein
MRLGARLVSGVLGKIAFFPLVFAWSKRGELLAKHGQKYVVARQGRKIPSAFPTGR